MDQDSSLGDKVREEKYQNIPLKKNNIKATADVEVNHEPIEEEKVIDKPQESAGVVNMDQMEADIAKEIQDLNQSSSMDNDTKSA